MKYKLLAVSSVKEVNIGDYIQALASAQFLPCVDGFIQREELKSYNGDECKVIMNGWYMHHSEQWPPSNKIIPLFVSFHINSLAKESLLSDSSIEYLKKYEPIGCRDTYTRDLLINKGVDAYYSACMTLTLGYSYKSNIRDEKCYFVDPYVHIDKKQIAKVLNLCYLLFHLKTAVIIAKKIPSNNHFFKKILFASSFYKQYRKIFSRELLINAEYISHQNKDYKDKFKDDYERLKEAESLICKYARAKLVITSRIHCALPCLGLNTPVIYVDKIGQSESSACRLTGLSDLFNTIVIDGYNTKTNFVLKEKISMATELNNKLQWKEYVMKMIQTCQSFVNQDEL